MLLPQSTVPLFPSLFVLAILALLCASTGSAQDNREDYCVLNITSTPDSADVTLDGVLRGTTPITCGELTPGIHVLHISKAGFLPFIDTLSFDEPGLFIRDIELIRWSTIEIDSDPSGASVYINGEPVGLTPRVIAGLPPEIVNVRVSKSTYATWSQSVSLQPGRKTDLHVQLVKASGMLTLQTRPADTEIFIDGNSFGKGSLGNHEIPSGSYSIQIRGPDGHSATHQVFVPPGGRVTLQGYVDEFTVMPLVASAVIPGLGQTINGAALKGIGILAAFSAAMAFTISANSDLDEKEKEMESIRAMYTLATREDEAFLLGVKLTQAHEEAESANNRRTLGLVIVGGIYAISIVDVLLHHSRSSGFDLLSLHGNRVTPHFSFAGGNIQCTWYYHF